MKHHPTDQDRLHDHQPSSAAQEQHLGTNKEQRLREQWTDSDSRATQEKDGSDALQEHADDEND